MPALFPRMSFQRAQPPESARPGRSGLAYLRRLRSLLSFVNVLRGRRAMHPLHRPKRPSLPALLALTVMFAALTGCTHQEEPWHLTNVSGHLPDLDFSLVADDGKPVTGQSFKGDTALVYFGYTHCPDVCPETMARLMQVMSKLGPDAQKVRILFITVDPARDTPKALHDYVGAFDAQHAVGLTGSDAQIETLARKYRVAYQMEKRDPNGDYDVTHSSAIYVFDAQGHARLLATGSDSADAIADDLRRIIDNPA
jgi:protein SCO1